MIEMINENNQPIVEKKNGLDQGQDHLGINIDKTKKETIKIRHTIQGGKPTKILKRETI